MVVSLDTLVKACTKDQNPSIVLLGAALDMAIPIIKANAKAYPLSPAADWVKEYIPEENKDYLDSEEFQEIQSTCSTEDMLTAIRKNKHKIREA